MKAEKRVVFWRGPRGVVLRPLNKKTDLELCVRGINDQDVNRFLRAYLPVSETAEERWFDSLEGRTNDVILAIETPDGRYIGNLGIAGIDWKNRTGLFGITLLDKSSWSRGYGTDAAMAMFEYAFHRLNLRRINSSVMAYNERSRRLHQALGMVREGTRRQENFIDGEYHDELLFGVFREEWEKAFAAYRKRCQAGAKGPRRRAT